MSTRSSIGMVLPDGTIKAEYCHSDGYLSHNGAILLNHYNTTEKVAELLELGDLSFLAENIGEKHDFDEPMYEWQKGYNDGRARVLMHWCRAYGRDRNEENCEAKIYKDKQDMINHLGQEYNYLWTGDHWLVNDSYNEAFKWLPLCQELIDKDR